MPLANIVTEPAVGFGVAGGLIFLHQSYAEALNSGVPPRKEYLKPQFEKAGNLFELFGIIQSCPLFFYQRRHYEGSKVGIA